MTATSIQEKREQKVLERSVEAQRAMVRLLYIVDPVKSLTKKQRDNKNFKQAKVIHITQCRKPEDMKSAMCIAHAELVSRDFMIRLTDISLDDQQFIMNALFRYFDPWRVVRKEDSITTSK